MSFRKEKSNPFLFTKNQSNWFIETSNFRHIHLFWVVYRHLKKKCSIILWILLMNLSKLQFCCWVCVAWALVLDLFFSFSESKWSALLSSPPSLIPVFSSNWFSFLDLSPISLPRVIIWVKLSFVQNGDPNLRDLVVKRCCNHRHGNLVWLLSLLSLYDFFWQKFLQHELFILCCRFLKWLLFN